MDKEIPTDKIEPKETTKRTIKSDGIKAVERGLRWSSHLNPELKKAENVVAMIATIMNDQIDRDTIQVRY